MAPNVGFAGHAFSIEWFGLCQRILTVKMFQRAKTLC